MKQTYTRLTIEEREQIYELRFWEKKSIRHIAQTVGSNPSKGIISHLSPIGEALIGKAVGDIATVELPNGSVVYTIVSITA